jgi:hypothetical protein
MKNTRRVTAVMRDQILSLIDTDVFEKRRGKVGKREAALVLAVMKRALPDFRRMQATPDGWLPKQKSVQVAMSSTYIDLIGERSPLRNEGNASSFSERRTLSLSRSRNFDTTRSGSRPNARL